jgi:predicted acetyltransferase
MANTAIQRMSSKDVVDVMFPLTSYAFQPSPPFRDEEKWKQIVREREGVTYLVLYEGSNAVSVAASTAMRQNMRGKIYDAGGVWGVATHPSARRKGYCKQLITRLMAEEREANSTFSNLYPFRESFYERLGYVTFPLPVTAQLTPSLLAPLLRKDMGGEVELVLIGDGYDTYRDFVFRLQRRTHGFGVFVHGQKTQAQREPSIWLALAKVGGRVAGVLTYHLKEDNSGELALQAYRFYYDSSQAKYLLLQWLARHVDQASEIEVWLAPYEQPETWLSDLRVRIETQQRAPMCRVVDVAGLHGMETGTGSFSARIQDDICPWNTGGWYFESSAGRLRVSPDANADSDLSIHALAALTLGSHDPADFCWRGWGDPSPAVQDAMRAMFPRMHPYLHEYF